MRFASQYGSYEVLNYYLSGELRRLPQPANFHWQHGWNPQVLSADPDLIIGEGGWARFQKDHLFLVARHDQAKALSDFGFSRAFAFGLPFAYALKIVERSRGRAPGSLLVMPADHHVAEDMESDAFRDSSYIASLLEEKHNFTKIIVSFHAEDLKRERHKPWISAGFEVTQGASSHEPSSLFSLANLLLQTEYCSTNGFGSHIAYAAASGCKVSIWGPDSKPVGGNRYNPSFFQNRPDLARMLDESLDQLASDLKARGFYCPPSGAVEHLEWGLSQIGYACVPAPKQALALLRKAFHENRPGPIGWLKKLALSGFWPKKFVGGLQTFLRKNQIFKSYWTSVCLGVNLSILKPNKLKVGRATTNLFQLLLPGKQFRKLRFLDTEGGVVIRPWGGDLASLVKVFGGRDCSQLGGLEARKIIDVGAGLGYFSVLLGFIFPQAEIEAVEPSAERHEVLRKQAELMPRINPVKLAIGVIPCQGSLVGGPGSNIRLKVVPAILENLETVEMVTLEDYLCQPRFEGGVDVLRLNLEGMEYEVLRDFGEILADKVGMLIVKFHYVQWRNGEISDIQEFFSKRGLVAVHQFDEYKIFIFERARAELS